MLFILTFPVTFAFVNFNWYWLLSNNVGLIKLLVYIFFVSVSNNKLTFLKNQMSDDGKQVEE